MMTIVEFLAQGLLAPAQFLAGWLLADLLSGIAHAIGDSEWANSSWVKTIIAFNKDHHARPLAIVDEPLLSRNLTNWDTTAAIVLPCLIWLGPSPMLAGLAAGGILVAEVHRWAHAPRRAPAAVRALQSIGLMQSPKHHARHHRPPHNVNFCLLTDWLNPIVDLLRKCSGPRR